ncbi:MAG: PKD domain-containing protein [Bacteroidetes bacterium]|nr:PKD domain-containing protein [Bacteroidota bacterium]
MRKFFYFFTGIALMLAYQVNYAQSLLSEQQATLVVTSEQMVEVPSIASQIANGTFIPAQDENKEYNPKKWGKNTAVPGKGFPKGNDPLWDQQVSANKTPGKAPSLIFEAASASATPTDPTGAVGPNHFVNAWNSSFRIWDKAGNALVPAAALGTVLNGNLGDPIVMYDRYADRFFISEFYSNGFSVAVTQGPDPVNDGWYVYNWSTSSFPDYPKYSIWSDGYYITANKDQSSPTTSEVVFAIERDAMLTGDPIAQMIGFPLTDIVISGFYSPLGFNCNGPNLPPVGNAPIVYMQDDVWAGVTTDHLKIWNVNVDWNTPSNSTISSPQIINVTAFDGLFDGGSFSNLPQPSGSDIDALQATIMYMAQYRRFTGYNSVVFNFVVDLDGGDDYSGIRWYELRQNNDGDPWTIYQEGTYSQPDGHSAFSGNMCMDANGNIALAYTSVSSSLNPSLRYTGRLASDPLGVMTMTEEIIANGSSSDPSTRYGDYSQMTIDPTDDATFWSIGEVFFSGRKNYVGVFQFAPPVLTAEFSASLTTVCAGGSVTFTDQSLGSPNSWTWSFPGGTPASYVGQNPPSITYNTPGTYNVSLTVGDGVDTDIETKTGYITVSNVIADFSGTPETVIVGNSVTFTDLSSCGPTGWTWSFPGGTPSSYSGQNPPSILYNTEGTYDVTLTVTKGSSSDIITKTDYITVAPPVFIMQNGSVTTCQGTFYDSGGPSASYSNNEDYVYTIYPSTAGAQIEVNFTEFSVESHSSCNYDYLNIYDGDNTSAGLIGQYCGNNSPGLVVASNPTGALTFEWHSDVSLTYPGWTASIQCLTNPPVADFTASNLTPGTSTIVTFTDISTGSPASWNWSFAPNTISFANGTNAGSQNPDVIFNEEVDYTVTLQVTNSYGSDTEVKTNYISVGPVSYCIPTYSTGTSDGDYISLVQLGDINNATGASASPFYTYYNSLSTNLTQGDNYTVTVSAGSFTSSNNITVWIDFNNDGTFETSERLGNVTLGAMPATGAIDFTVPVGAAIGITRMRVREVWNNTSFDACSSYGYGETEDYNVNIQSPDLRLNLVVMLEGPYDGLSNQMLTSLNSSGHLPTAQPYNPSLPYYNNNSPVWLYGGTETVGAIPANVVDWVVVQLRDAASPATAVSSTAVGTRAGFILADGSIVATDGVSPLSFPVSYSQNLYVVVFHRNHLGIISNVSLTEAGGFYNYDFTTSSSQTYGDINAVKELEPGVWGMVGADGDANGLVQNTDETEVWKNDLGSSGYTAGDFDLNGLTQNTDETDLWKPNLGGGGQVPGKVPGEGYRSYVPQ